MNKRITKYGYIVKKSIIKKKDIDKIKDDLEIVPQLMGNYGKMSKNKNFSLYDDNEKYIRVPKYYGIKKFGEPDINILESYDYPTYDIKYINKLWPNQKKIVNKIRSGFDIHHGGLLIAGCGSGKTNMAIYIACKYKLKTLFIVHKDFLGNQIIKRIQSTTNIKKVGIIKQKIFDVNHPFVVGTIQKLLRNNYDEKILAEFGMIIIDEVHHMGAKIFSTFFKKISAKYMLGLSAERRRADGTFKIINLYMGPILHYEEQKPNDMVIVKTILYKTSNEERSKIIIQKYSGEIDRSTMITNLIYIKKRNRLIVEIIEQLHNQGKNILCLSGRISQVNLIYKLLDNNIYLKNSIGKYIGGMKENDLNISASKQIIIGTFSMAQEGLDIGNLNVVLLCTPKSAIKQSVGRILRKDHYEECPIVIDIIDQSNEVFVRQALLRSKYYIKQKYNIQKIKISDYKLQGYTDWNNVTEIKDFLSKGPNIKSDTNYEYSDNNKYDNIDFSDDD